jgi:hypothetical protein
MFAHTSVALLDGALDDGAEAEHGGGDEVGELHLGGCGVVLE